MGDRAGRTSLYDETNRLLDTGTGAGRRTLPEAGWLALSFFVAVKRFKWA
jgi:hypothetical protein